LTVEKDNAQQHGNAQYSLKIGEELDMSIKSALDDLKTDPGADQNQLDDLIKLSRRTRHWFMKSIVRSMEINTQKLSIASRISWCDQIENRQKVW
jgi:hypothetical protein